MKKLLLMLTIISGMTIITDVLAGTTTAPRVAVLPFTDNISAEKTSGADVTDLIFAELSAGQEIQLVERAKLNVIIGELSLGHSGMINEQQAGKIGQLAGAQILVTGSIFKSGSNIYIIAKIIGTENGRVFAAKATGKEDIAKLAEQVAREIAAVIARQKTTLLPTATPETDKVARLKKELAGKKLPKVFVAIKEEHIGAQTIDPAIETEFQAICLATGFTVVNGRQDAEIIISGEAFSQFAAQHDSLISVKARAEVKATDTHGNILAAGQETIAQVGLSEQIVGKNALQQIGHNLALVILPKIVK